MLERVLSWGVALTLSALLLALALEAFVGASPNAVFGLIAMKTGVSAFEPNGRYAAGALQGIAAVLLLLPRLRAMGAALGLGLSLAAVALHLTPWLGVELPLADQASAAIRAGATSEQIAALPTDNGAMFLLALAILVLSAASLILERALPRRGPDAALGRRRALA